ncbi:MAG: O-antigen ligase family protein [Rikenellaceae bacterium]|nr:O-antigen ligase family protein [Rikenellaceae bacterium]
MVRNKEIGNHRSVFFHVNGINITKWVMFVLVLFQFEPDSFLYLAPTLHDIFVYMKMASFIMILTLFMFSKKKCSGCFWLILGFLIILNIATIVNAGEIYSCVVFSFGVLATMLAVQYMFEEDILLCMDVITLISEILVYVNFLTIILFPNGMYTRTLAFYQDSTNYFLGQDNTHIMYYLMAIVVSLIRRYYYTSGDLKLKIREWILISVCVLSVFICQQGMARIIIFILMFYFVFRKFINKFGAFNILSYSIVIIAVVVIVVILQNVSFLSIIVQNVLGKSMTLSGRTTIWNRAVGYIISNPVTGYGYLDSATALTMLKQYSAHNMYLQILMETGVIGFVLFLGAIVLTVRNLYRIRNCEIGKIMAICMFCLLMTWVAEANSKYSFIGMSIMLLLNITSAKIFSSENPKS